MRTKPWKFKNDPFPDGRPYCTISDEMRSHSLGGFEISGIIELSDARLMANAPAMLNALLTLKTKMQEEQELGVSGFEDWIEIIDTAANSATGETNV